MKPWPTTTVICALLCVHALAETHKPNILLFLVDDMALMDTSVPMLTNVKGKPERHPLNDWYRTPNMERLAAQGVRFSNFYSHNVCSPTRISIMSGQNSARHRATDYILPWYNNRKIDNKMYPLAVCQQVPPEWRWEGLGKDDVTLPRQLKQAGYITIHVGKAHFAPHKHEGEDPLDLGFDVNIAGSSIGAPGSYYGKAGYGKNAQGMHARPVPDLDKYHGTDTFLTEALTLEAKAQLDKALDAGRPFFLHMSHYAVHSPFNSDPRFAAHYRDKEKPPAVQAYATLIEGMDKSLGDLMDHLEAKGIAENTLILFLGDNGGDVPSQDPDAVDSSAPLRGRKGGKWEGGMRVPFIAAWGKADANNPWQKKLSIPANAIRQEIGTCYDLFPTLADLVGVSIPEDHPIVGQNLLSLLSGQSDQEHKDEFLNHYPHPRRGQSHFFTTWREEDWKVIYQYLAEGNDRYALYDLAKDPSESRNLAATHPDKLRKMMQGMVRELETREAVYPVKNGEVLKAVLPQEATKADASAGEKPNIIFILADDMGYGDVSCYGAEKIKTPNIDQLAKEGILFTDAHSECSTCTPTRYGLLTGRYCFRTRLKYSALSTSAPLLIEEDRVTVASFLKTAGYSTSIVGKWHLGYGSEEGFEDQRGDTPPNYWETRRSGPNWNGELKPGPLEVGFDYSYVIPVANSFPPYVFVENHHVAGLREDSPIGKLESKNHGKMEGGKGARWKDEELVDMMTSKAITQLEGFAREQKPFFLFYAPHQPHIPHRPNARFKGTSGVGAYGDVIQVLDWSVGEIIKTLDRLNLNENTLVVFSSDNGPDGAGRPRQGHWPRGQVMRGGKGGLLEGSHRVPFIARWPGKIEPGTRSTETISLTDMLATFAAIIGKELPPSAGPDSDNVLPALLGKKLPDPDRPLVMLSGGIGALSIRAGKWKLIEGQGNCGYAHFVSSKPKAFLADGKPMPDPTSGDLLAQLYNLAEDLGETNNLYTQHPEIVQRLRQSLEEIKASEH